MKKLSLLLISIFLCTYITYSQKQNTEDSIKTVIIPLVTVEAEAPKNGVTRLSPVQGTYIFSGKKSEVLSIKNADMDIANKTGRQLFAKVPGVFVYDMDGAGNQVNVSSRGLDPHRGWELNIRKDGMLTNSDMYGYPASHYSIPMESVDRIEFVRGTGSLQYGSQFGGMLNYSTKEANQSKAINFESFNTIGSFNLLSSYNAIGGKIGDFKYYAYVTKKSREGYRDIEHTDYDAEDFIIAYEPNEDFSLRLEWARSNYLYRTPGPLTDKMFQEDPTQASRTRNYFNPTINIPSLLLKWNLAPSTKLQFSSSAVIGDRNSVLFDKIATIADTVVTSSMEYNNRQVDIDRFNSYTNEIRVLQQYELGEHKSNLVAGIQFMNNDLQRTQLGRGTTGNDYDLTRVIPEWGRDLHFKTQNIALFAENNFQLLKNLAVNLGARVEIGESEMSGTISYYPEHQIPVIVKHNFPLFGGGFSFKPNEYINIYGGFSQAYRPMIFKDLVPGSLYEKVDPNIKDADGYNAEFGFRGNWEFLQWDITGFLLQYNNRFGALAQNDGTGQFYTYRTNIGNSLTKGVEIFVEGHFDISQGVKINVFTSTSLMNGEYTSGEVKSGNNNIAISGNAIESVPSLITRNGINFSYKTYSISGLFSHISETFADALNTELPSASGAVGLVPAYSILDINASAKISDELEIKGTINNLTDVQYFTKRPLFYPGPGVWPSDGRNYTMSFIVRI